MRVSLVLPIYNEQLELAEVLAKYVADLKQCKKIFEEKSDKKPDGKSAASFAYEIIAVNDGSDDGTLGILLSAAKLNRNLRVINLDGRWGKQAAINAGMEAAKGDAVILADIDILNPVGILQRMLQEHLRGSKIVYAERERFGFEAVKNSWSNAFVRFSAGLFGISGRYTGRTNVMLFARDVVDVINALPHKNKLLRTMDTWIEWEIKHITYASGYNKQEEQSKRKAAIEQLKGRGKEPPARSNIREHSASRAYGNIFSWLAIFVLAVSVVFLFALDFDIGYHILLWSMSLILAFISLMFYCRAALIKRIGVIHSSKFTDEIYQIKNIIN